MGCCGAATRIHTARVNGKVLVPPGEEDTFTGPLHERVCRDVVFLILFIAFVIGAIVFLIYVGTKSDPQRLIHGNDMYGNVCGRKNKKISKVEKSGEDFSKKPYFRMGVGANTNDLLAQGGPVVSGTCSASCPAIESTLIGFLCIPVQTKGASNLTDELTSRILGVSLTDFFEGVNKDLQVTWVQILILCIIAFALAIVITILLRFMAKIVVWVCVIVMVVGLIGGSIYLWVSWYLKKSKLQERKDSGEDMSDLEVQVEEKKVRLFMVLAVVATIVTVLMLLLLLVMRKRIMLVIALFTEAGKAVASMPLLLLQPLWTCFWLALVCLMWLLGWVLIESSGDPQRYKEQVFFIKSSLISGMRWYHIFAFFWISQFVLACQDVTIAGSVAQWYFTRNKKELGWPILIAMKRMYRYHLGSIALGSFIIAVVKTIRYIFKTIERQLSRSGNQCCACLLKCCQCCLWCFEKFLKFLNRNAYIEIAIYGYGFCKAAQKAFTLLVSNILRVAAINSVGAFVLFLAKACIVGITVVIGFQMLKNREDVSYMWVPLLIVALFAYFIAHCFISVYEMTIDTLFLCFCEDCERNDGLARPYFMSKGLMKFVENSRKALEALDEREHVAKGQQQVWATTVQPVGSTPGLSPAGTPVHGGMTPLHPAYPATSVPPTPTHFLTPPSH